MVGFLPFSNPIGEHACRGLNENRDHIPYTCASVDCFVTRQMFSFKHHSTVEVSVPRKMREIDGFGIYGRRRMDNEEDLAMCNHIPSLRALFVGVETVEPVQLVSYSLFCVVRVVNVLRSELGLHGIDEHGGVVVAPFLKVRDIECHHHAACC